MAIHEIKEPKEFTVDLRKFETTDKAHANLFNAVASIPINNDAFLYGVVEALNARLTEELAGKVPVTRKVNNKPLSADISLSATDVSAIPASIKGAAGGVAELDSTGKVLAAQLPSFVDDVVDGYLSGGKMYKEAAHTTVITGEAGKIYIDLHTSKTYRWSGTAYVVISDTIALGETASTAYRGDRGKIAYDHSQSAHAPANAEQNVQTDWNVTDTASDAYLKNKPKSLPANGGNATTVNGKTVESNVPANAKFTDTTYTNMKGATTSAAGAAGLAPAPSAGAANRYLRSDGTWAVPPDNNTTYANMKGATTSAAGAAGLAPAPSAGAANRYLRSDGTWAVPPDNNTTYANMKGATTSAAGAAGLTPAPSAGAANRYLRSDGTWAVPPDTNTVYTHPLSEGNKHVPAGGSSGQFLKWSAAGTATWASLIDNLLATVKGSPLDATQGKVLDDKITALNGKLTDTGWQNLANGRISYRVKNGWCIVNGSSIGHITLSGSTDTDATTLIATLPAGARPSQLIRENGTAMDNTGYDPQFNITSNGEIRGRLNKASGTINHWAFNIAFPV